MNHQVASLAETLLPCPFCSGTPKMKNGHGDMTFVLCDDCGAITSFRPNLKANHAVDAWNRRAKWAN